MEDVTYRLLDGEFEWSFNSFSVPYKQLCGFLMFTPNLGALEGVVHFEKVSRTFSIDSGDASLALNSPYEYTVTSEYSGYPGYGVKTGMGTITILNGCSEISTLSVGSGSDMFIDFEAVVEWKFPTIALTPPSCIAQATYSCVDLEFGDACTSKGFSFNSETGALTYTPWGGDRVWFNN
jgi:hypothetical protein